MHVLDLVAQVARHGAVDLVDLFGHRMDGFFEAAERFAGRAPTLVRNQKELDIYKQYEGKETIANL